MATESLGDIFVSDLLSELNLKPWWEKYRGYCFAVSVAAALSMYYVLQTVGSMACFPVTNRTEIIEDFSVPVANFVNKFCVLRNSLPVPYACAIALGSCVLLIIISTFWLHIPKVIDAFKTYLETEKSIEKIHLSTEKLKILLLTVTPLNHENEDVKKVRKACEQLWNYEIICELRKFYVYRSVALCVTSLVTSAAALWMLISLLKNADGILRCTLQHEISSVNNTTYICKDKTTTLVILLTITFFLSVNSHLIFVVIGIWKTWECSSKYIHHTPDWRKVGDLFRFINIFRRNSRPISSTTCHDFLDFLATSAPEQLKNLLKIRPDLHDIYLIELCPKLLADWGVIAKSFYRYVCHRNRLSDAINDDIIRLLGIVASGTLLTLNNDAKNLLDFFWNEKHFELFVALLNIELSKKGDYSVTEYLVHFLTPTFDAVGQRDLQGRSLLYYALCRKSDGTICRTAALRILKYYRAKPLPSRNGFNYTVTRFPGFQISSRFGFCRTKDELDCEVKRLIQDKEKLDDERKSGINNILHIIERCNSEASKKGLSNNFWRNIRLEISLLKFTPWNEEINKFARDLCGEKIWDVLVALMNAYIVEDGEHSKNEATKYVISNCNLDLKDAVTLTNENVGTQTSTLLGEALSVPCYRPFAFNAAATILSLTKGMEKAVRRDKNGVQRPDTFVRENSDLTNREKKLLFKLIADSSQDIDRIEMNSQADNNGSISNEFSSQEKSRNNQFDVEAESDQENGESALCDIERAPERHGGKSHVPDIAHHEIEGRSEPRAEIGVTPVILPGPEDNPEIPLLP